jgi:hypothetical protein
LVIETDLHSADELVEQIIERLLNAGIIETRGRHDLD